MSNSTITTSLQELITSGVLSECKLFLDNESATDETLAPTNEHEQFHLNCSKVALMLAKLFSVSFGNLKTQHKVTDPASQILDNYFIMFKRVGEAKIKDDDDDDPLLQVPLDISTKSDRSYDTLASLFGDQPPTLPSAQNVTSEYNWVITSVYFHPMSTEPPRNKLIGNREDNLLPIQILGNLFCFLYSNKPSNMFDGGLVRLVSMSPKNDEVQSENIDNSLIDSNPGAAKMRRSNEGSLFSRLLEADNYPVAICRLLSDMIDRDSDNPFKSLEEIASDLERMCSYPHILVQDPNITSSSANLVFGQTYCGRAAELSELLEITTRLELTSACSSNEGLGNPLIEKPAEAVFISGAAGSGKTHLATQVGSFLSNIGWMMMRGKFERDVAYGSYNVVSSVFDNFIQTLVEMQDQKNPADSDYSRCASEAIANSLGPESLSFLSDFLPSLRLLIPCPMNAAKGSGEQSFWQLVFSLSKLLDAILGLDRHVICVLDDLQWSDDSMLCLIKELIIAVGRLPNEKQKFLLVATYRDNEIFDSHPFVEQFNIIKQSKMVTVTEMNMSPLMKSEIVEMISAETMLPLRYVSTLADDVHRKTSGHALFVVQHLNSLVRASLIYYSPQLRRFDWDMEKVRLQKAEDSVANLIISNLMYLQPDDVQRLRILACFGIQTHMVLIDLLEDCPQVPRGGISSSLPRLIDCGIVERREDLVIFCHDLIQQSVYESMPLQERQKLHLDIGTFLGSITSMDNLFEKEAGDPGIDELFLGERSNHDEDIVLPSSLTAIATSQINKSGTTLVENPLQRGRFAFWNLKAGMESMKTSNFHAALYYLKHGIDFLAEQSWGDSFKHLTLELHEEAAFAAYASGAASDAQRYATSIIDHVPFEESLAAQYLLIRLDEFGGKYDGTISRGLAVLKKLNIDIAPPSMENIVGAMKETHNITAQYNANQIISLHHNSVNPKTRNVLKIMDAMTVACYKAASPYMALVACAIVNYSLQNGVCEQSASAFMVYAYFKVILEGNYLECRYWADLALAVIVRAQTPSIVARSRMMLFGFVMFLFIPLKDSSRALLEAYEIGMSSGDVDAAMTALLLHLRFSFFQGENLSVLSMSYDKKLKSMAKFNKESAKYAVLDNVLLNRLIGKTDDPFLVFEGMISDETSLLSDAKSRKNFQLVELIHLQRFFSSFWFGDYITADEAYKSAKSCPSSKMPKVQLLSHTFYRGLMCFKLYHDGKGEHWLEEGEEMLVKFEMWHKNGVNNAENKMLLLRAEHFRAQCEIAEAKKSYDASIMSARECGFIHEQGLAYEFMGNFMVSIIENASANMCFKHAYECFMFWGAKAKADAVREAYNIDLKKGRKKRSKAKQN